MPLAHFNQTPEASGSDLIAEDLDRLSTCPGPLELGLSKRRYQWSFMLGYLSGYISHILLLVMNCQVLIMVCLGQMGESMTIIAT